MLQAERDLKFAHVVFQPEGYYLAAFLAHQAAEKSLKAACWHLRGEEPPWRHGLSHTARLLVQEPRDIPVAVGEAIALLNSILEQTRYPSGDVDDPGSLGPDLGERGTGLHWGRGGRNGMGDARASRKTEQPAPDEELLSAFARLLRDRHSARLYLFGSRARGLAREYSDYDLVAVSPAFRNESRFRRCLDREEMWVAAGGWRKALDLHCYSPEEFRREIRGLGYLRHAREQGELVLIKVAPRRKPGAAA